MQRYMSSFGARYMGSNARHNIPFYPYKPWHRLSFSAEIRNIFASLGVASTLIDRNLLKNVICFSSKDSDKSQAALLYLVLQYILYVDGSTVKAHTVKKKSAKKFNFNLLMGWSISYISLTFQWFATFTAPHKQIFIENSIFAIFLLLVDRSVRLQ